MLGAAAGESAAVSAASIVRLLIFDLTGVVRSASCAMYSAKNARRLLSSAMALYRRVQAASGSATGTSLTFPSHLTYRNSYVVNRFAAK